MAYAWTKQVDYDYVAYIDESGDPGLKTVKPIDVNGSSEWMVVSAVVIDARRESQVERWVLDICKDFRGHQRYGFHFRDLIPAKKRVVCSKLAVLPIRVFAIASNKKNMRGYRNPWAEKIPSDNWFYCWMTRLLLERVTYFVHHHSITKFGEPRRLKLEYSERGGLSYSQMAAYYEWLQIRTSAGQNKLPMGFLHFDVMDPSLLEVHPHEKRLGLHMADAAAYSFFKAADKYDTGGCDPEFAKLLSPRIARDPDELDGLAAGYGVKLIPNRKVAKLDADQDEVFQFFGYPNQWWAPDPDAK